MAGTVTGPVRQAFCKANGDYLAVARIQALDELARAVHAGDVGMARRLSDLVIEIEQRLAERASGETDTLARRMDIAARAGLPAGHHYAAERKCESCGKPFRTTDNGRAESRQRYCSPACRQAASRRRRLN